MRRCLLALAAAAVILGSGCRRRTEAPGAAAGSEAAAPATGGRWQEAAAKHAAAALAAGPRQADESVRQAMAAWVMAGDSAAAERFTAACLERDPSYHRALYYLGDAHRVLLDHESARQVLERFLVHEPGHVQGTVALAQSLARLGRHGEAVPHLEKVLAGPGPGVTPEVSRGAALELARSLRALGRNVEAADRLARLLEETPFDTLALAAAAQAFALLGRQEIARGLKEEHAWLFRRGHQLSSEDETREYRTGPRVGSQVRLALQAADRRELLRATTELEGALAREPEDAVLRAALARLWLRLYRLEDVLRVARGAPAGAEPGAEALALAAEALAALGAREEAGTAWLQASRRASQEPASNGLDPTRSLDIHLKAAAALLEPPADASGAEECALRAANLAPDDWRPPCASGRVALARGDAPAALERFAAARKLLPVGAADPPLLRRWLAAARGLQGDLRVAARELATLIGQDPADSESFRAFALVFGAHRDNAEVRRVLSLEQALGKKLDAVAAAARAFAARDLAASGGAALSLGKLLLAQGDRDRALDLFFLAAELEPASAESLRLAAGALTAPREAFQRLRALRRLLALAPDDVQALAATVRLYLHLGVRLDEAERLASRLVAASPGDEAGRLLEDVRAARGVRGG